MTALLEIFSILIHNIQLPVENIFHDVVMKNKVIFLCVKDWKRIQAVIYWIDCVNKILF